jgi:2-methylcitrate dehydratase PrpD
MDTPTMKHSPLPSEELAAFVAAHPFRSVPEQVLREGRRRILDTLGVALGARRTRPVEILLSVTRELGGTPQAGVPGLNFRSSVPSVARLLGVMSHLLDFDDTHTPTILHPSGPTLAAALPLAERQEASGRELLAAFTFGVEAGCRVALALGPAHYDVGWHVTGTAGTVAAAAACSRLLRLDEARTHEALSIAATEAAGQRAQFGAMTKSLHTGNAAANGALAALLAENGYTAGRRGFEGPRGLLNAASARPSPGELAADLGERWETLRIGIKPYSCGVVTHPAIDAMRRLARLTSASGEEVERIDLAVHPLVMELTNKRNPRTGLEGKFSIAFAAAITWIEGTARHRQFTDEKVNRPDVKALMDRVCVAGDNSLSQIEARATVCLRGGKTSSEHIYHATGTPENPISDEELREKFTELVEPELGARAVQRIFACVEKLREDKPLKPLFDALAPAAAVPE